MTMLTLKPIFGNKFYLTNNERFICCDEVQYRYFCDNHFEAQGCQFCEFDPYQDCECDK